MDSDRAGQGPAQLRPGPHCLPRSFVASNQRERIIKAVAEAVYEAGYAGTSVEDIVKRARVSRRTFYELYANKEEAFHAAFDRVSVLLIAGVRHAYLVETDYSAKVVAGYRAFLEILANAPEFADMCIVEVLAAGREAVEKRTRVMEEFARMIDENAPRRQRPALPELTADTIVGGVYERIYRKISARRTAELPALLPDLVEFTLLPYLGEDQARAVSERLRSEASGSPEVPDPAVHRT